jgi:hypothetical protein
MIAAIGQVQPDICRPCQEGQRQQDETEFAHTSTDYSTALAGFAAAGANFRAIRPSLTLIGPLFVNWRPYFLV